MSYTRYIAHYLENVPEPPIATADRKMPAIPVQPAQQPVKTQAVVGNPPMVG